VSQKTQKKTEIKAEPNSQEIWITREFDAPVERVFRAFTDPELIVKWLGPRRLSMRIDTMESGDGGRYRFIHSGDDGIEHAFRGVVHSVTAPTGMTRTFEYEGLPGHISLETVNLEDLGGGRTRMVQQAVFQSIEDRNGMVESGMEEGVNDSMERLSELLESVG